jgi:pimeloyl-ACP methyl ester carboxylesterase
MASTPIILVPGFWLGAWAWDEVVPKLKAAGHDDVTALTLPGMDSPETDRRGITLQDHVDAIVAALEGAQRPAVLAVHSASGFSGYVASDLVPERIAAMVYVDTAPGKPPLDPNFDAIEKPLVWDEIEAEENLDDLSDEQKATFRERALPVPGGVIRGRYEFTNEARLDIPSTVIATGFTAAEYQQYAKQEPVPSWLAGLGELRNLTWVDLPTSHWPMWSKPDELARIIGDIATVAAERSVAGAGAGR